MSMQKSISLVLLTAVGVGAGLWLYKSLGTGTAPATAKGVTDSTKGGVTSTPIQTSKVAVAGLNNALDWIGTVTDRAAALIPGNLSNGSYAGNWRIPFGNTESANAAANAPKQTNVSNYAPSAWSSIKFRTGV
jgi:hypothetical protein